MALKTQFPLFAPPHLLPQPHRAPTEIRFSRWNNANAQKFIRHERNQKEIEDQLRFEKRFDSALVISHNYNPAPPHHTVFKSTGTPSAPSSPSIPGKSSKYSKPPPHKPPHPAFKPPPKPRKIPIPPANEIETPNPVGPNFRIDENGVSYEMPEAPFVYQYSYTETPKVKPVKLREPLMSPFGPVTMAKPWLGRRPLPPSKRKLPEFDSFQLPPPHKKGVKPVQAPGPFLPGSGPKYVNSREEILGDPLSKEEIKELIDGSKKSNRQLNMGRDGLTHNMLDNIHALWKRRRVCKIKCKGVCTVDMENVCQQLEDKTGGKIIYNRGGVIYLFRGRNYNYKSRPRFPLMLWKPISPVYPRLVRRVPEGLTLEEASAMRKKGRDLTPICKLAKNGVYSDLVENVREAFEACELVRINCQGLNPSDHKKIGAKLKDLVPCVLISFEYEHILVWRGRDWKSTLDLNGGLKGSKKVEPAPGVTSLLVTEATSNDVEDDVDESEKFPVSSSDQTVVEPKSDQTVENELTVLEGLEEPKSDQTVENDLTVLEGLVESQSDPTVENDLQNLAESQTRPEKKNTESTQAILLLRNQAVENGMALVFDEHSLLLDSDAVFKTAVAFAKTAPVGPVFSKRPKKAVEEVEKGKKKNNKGRECNDLVLSKEGASALGTEIYVSKGRDERKNSSRNEKLKDIRGDYLNVVPQGNLGIDELARLLR
ncbi:hypothetical protein ABFX02_11G051700 [Erythranthe guttata]